MTAVRTALLSSLASCFLAFGAHAQDLRGQDLHVSDGLICGTAEQAKTFVARHPEVFEAPEALSQAENDVAKDDCLVAGIAFIPGKELDRVQGKAATYAVREILIVAIATPYGIQKVKPNLAYTVVKVEEEKV